MIPVDLPASHITAPDGARALVMHDGGHVVSWTPAGESENRLYVSERSTYGPGRAIRGGIPIIFPQFGLFGSLTQHGFARNRRWSIASHQHPHDNVPDGSLRLQLTDTTETRALWPHRFLLELDVLVAADTLRVALHVHNTDHAPFAFTAAFHPYLAMRDAFTSRVDGLHGLRYRDALREGIVFDEHDASLAIVGPLDRIYYSAPDTLVIHDGNRSLHLTKANFPEAVVWNPGSDGTNSRADFVPGDEHRMLCVEAALIAQPRTLMPGESWSGAQTIRAA